MGLNPKTVAAYKENKFPVYIHTAPKTTCITYQPVLDGETVEDLLCHIRTEANIPSAIKSSFALFTCTGDLTKTERVANDSDLTDLFRTLRVKQTPLVYARWNVFDDQIMQAGDDAISLIFNEQKLIEKFSQATSLAEIKDDDDYDAWTFQPCTCDLRSDGSLIVL